MPLTLRPGKPEDATVCGAICYEAFRAIAAQHNCPPSYASPEVARDRIVERLPHPGFYAVVAELDGRVVGSNFLDERSPIAGLGPITVDPTVQNRSIGRHLIQDVLDRVATQHRLSPIPFKSNKAAGVTANPVGGRNPVVLFSVMETPLPMLLWARPYLNGIGAKPALQTFSA